MRSHVLASIAGYRSTSYRSLNALMTNVVVHSVPTGSEYFQIDSFLLAPVQFRQDPGGPTVPPVSQVKTTDRYADLWHRIAVNNLVPLNDYETLPLDMYCPSVKSAVKQRVCNLYGIYFPSIAAVKQHKAGKGCEEGEYDDEEGSDDGDNYEEEEDRNDDTEVELVDGENECPVLNIFELLQNPTFVEDDDL